MSAPKESLISSSYRADIAENQTLFSIMGVAIITMAVEFSFS